MKLETRNSKLISWLTLQLIPLLLYLPWLPTAWRQVTTWPSEWQAGSLLTTLKTISTTLLFGHSWPYNFEWLAAVILGMVLAVSLAGGRWQVAGGRGNSSLLTPHLSLITYHSSLITLLWLWLLLPVLLTALIFSPAFLKFLLVATPPLALLLALAIEQLVSALKRSWPGYAVGEAILLAVSVTSALSLFHYYTNPVYARDNYRGIVQFISAVGGPEDAIILNAEGQQDVFNYYYNQNVSPGAPVYPLPRSRPLDEAETLAELQNIAADAQKIYAVYWATHQADPNGLIENWLNTHLFKATDWWYGNVRLASYASPPASDELTIIPVDYKLGENIQLTGYARSASQITPGDILQAVLQWKANAALAENYTVFLQVLDQNNHLVGQRDAQPVIPTSGWPVGELVQDAYGLFIEPGTPPGSHRLVVGLYNSQTGQRLPLTPDNESSDQTSRDFIELVQLEVERPSVPLPVAAFDMQSPMDVPMLGVTLLGYDFYKVGHRSAPDTPLHPGDPVHLVAYWQRGQSEVQLENELAIRVVKNNGEDTPVMVTRPLAGTDYPVSEWQTGEIVRAQYDFFLSGLKPGVYRLKFRLYDRTSADVAEVVTKPFQVE